MTPPRLLLVDDAPEIALIVRRYCHRAGIAVDARADPAAARDALAAARQLPDLLLLDVNLPGESGVELCRRLKGEPRFADLPVIAASET